MTSWSPLASLLWIAALALASPAHASVDSHRAEGDSAGETKLYSNYIYVHAIFMAIIFLFLIPVAILASRFGRYVMGRKWFATHAALNGVAVCLFFTTAFGVGWVAASPTNLTHSHHKIGVITFALLFFQFLLGVGITVFHRTQSQKPRECRSTTDLIHMWFGRIVLLLGWCQLWDGVLFFGSPLVVYILLAIAQGLILAIYIGLEFKVKEKSPLKSPEQQFSEKSPKGSDNPD